MKINLSIIVSLVVLIIGFSLDQLYLWIPASVFIAGFIDVVTKKWVVSDKLGNFKSLSLILKFVCALAGFYAMIGQIICIGLVGWWLIF